jgi:dTDP-glucose 4,6-dehydratase
MKILLTGGCGFIGSAVVRHLLRHSDHVIVNVDKMTYAASEEALEEGRGHNRHVLVRACVTDGAAMRQVFAAYSPDAVMHLAAESHVDRSIDGPADFVQTNVVGTFTLLDAAREHWSGLPADRRAPFRFHHISTDEVFGSREHDAAPFTEDTAYDPRSPYAASKAASDHLVRAWFHTYGLPVLVSNTCNNYGPWQFPEKLIPLVTLNALEGKPLPVYGDGSNRRDWLFVEDHAAALVRVLERGTPGATYAIGARQTRSNLEVVRAICAELDRIQPDPAGPRERLIRFVTDRPGHDFRYEIDPTRSEAALDWTAPHDFAAGLAKTVDWYIANRAWWQEVRARRYAGERLGTPGKAGAAQAAAAKAGAAKGRAAKGRAAKGRAAHERAA